MNNGNEPCAGTWSSFKGQLARGDCHNTPLPPESFQPCSGLETGFNQSCILHWSFASLAKVASAGHFGCNPLPGRPSRRLDRKSYLNSVSFGGGFRGFSLRGICRQRLMICSSEFESSRHVPDKFYVGIARPIAR